MNPDPPLGFEPRQQRSIAARDRLFAAAMELFAQRGVEGTRVEDIVAAAGAAWGTFFRYFPRKEDVLLRAARMELERLVPLVEEGIADGRPARELAGEFFHLMLMPGTFPAEVHGAIIRESVAQHDRYLAMLAGVPPTFELVLRIVELGRARGEVRTDDPPMLQAGVLACGTIYPTLYGFYDVHRSLRGAPRTTPEPVIARSFAVAWRGLAALEQPTDPVGDE